MPRRPRTCCELGTRRGHGGTSPSPAVSWQSEGTTPSALGRASDGGHGCQAGGRFFVDTGREERCGGAPDGRDRRPALQRAHVAAQRSADAAPRPPNVFTEAQEASIAEAMELWTASGRLLTRKMMATTLRDYVADMGAKREAQAKAYFGADAVPGKTWFAAFFRRLSELRRVEATSLDEARARAATLEAVAKYFAALTAVTRQYNIQSASQVYDTDESMINVADVLRFCGRQDHTSSPTR